MKFDEAYKIINENKVRNFRIIHSNGAKELMALFISTNDNICYRKKRSRHYGYIVPNPQIESWSKIIPVVPKKSQAELIRFKLNNIVKYLAKSNLWGNVKKTCESLLSFTDDELLNLFQMNYCDQLIFLNERNIEHTFPMHMGLIKNQIKNIRYPSRYSSLYQKDMIKILGQANESIKFKWRHGYDNTISIAKIDDDNIRRAWYSEEFLNTGNGHYYIMLDENHALHCEDD